MNIITPPFRAEVCEILDSEYFAAPGVSQSALKEFRRSPAHYRASLAAKREPTAAMEFGTAFDLRMFDRDAFIDRVAIRPEGLDGRTKDGKAWKDANAGKITLSAMEGSDLEGMRRAIMDHKSASAALSSGRGQQAVFAPFETGSGLIQCKGKIDWVPPVASRALVDLKTTLDASPADFGKTIWNLSYHVQAAFYLDMWNLITGEDRTCFVFVAVEKEPPYAVSVFNLDPEAIRIGRDTYQRDLVRFIECQRSGVWPAYSDEIVEI